VQHIKIYLPCNFEVNLTTQFGVIAFFSIDGDTSHGPWARRAKKMMKKGQ
jgi:hypothetical protein